MASVRTDYQHQSLLATAFEHNCSCNHHTIKLLMRDTSCVMIHSLGLNCSPGFILGLHLQLIFFFLSVKMLRECAFKIEKYSFFQSDMTLKMGQGHRNQSEHIKSNSQLFGWCFQPRLSSSISYHHVEFQRSVQSASWGKVG